MEVAAEETRRGALSVDRPERDTLTVRFSGTWTLGAELPPVEQALGPAADGVRRISFDASAVTRWDTGLVAFVFKLMHLGLQRDIETDPSGLPEGARRLLDLAFAVPKAAAHRTRARRPWLARVGGAVLELGGSAREALSFVGEATASVGRLVTGRARLHRSDLALLIQESGAQALGIVGLISFLVGLILAYIGAVQFRMFGAEIYVANLVGIAMAREMAAIMTAILMAGRTGAAYAARLGTMTVNEEIDALRTFGISPMDFLVLPRMLALVLMLPLLTVYSNLLGIAGGLVVGTTFGIPAELYWNQTTSSVGMSDFAVGLFKSAVFGVLVAISGCMRGMQSGRSASAVGDAATSAVVTAIVLIIVSDALFAVLCSTLGI